MAKKKSLIKLVQELIEKGATTAEDIHKAIAEMPLKMLEKIDVLRTPEKRISRVQDESIGAVYDLIRDINDQAARLATELLEQARGTRVGRSAERVADRAAAAATRAAKAAKAKAKAATARAMPAKAPAKKKPAKAAAKKRPAAKPAASKAT